tara:strand:+ start:1820 stop:2143 length:324 start_codon:yes stop_codon:yes gene_type:complete
MLPQYEDYDDYWNCYLIAHSKKTTRLCHYIAFFAGCIIGLTGIFTLNIWLVLIAIIQGYVLAVGSHFMIQKNKPLITRPIWGAVSVARMFMMELTGKLTGELKRQGI